MGYTVSRRRYLQTMAAFGAAAGSGALAACGGGGGASGFILYVLNNKGKYLSDDGKKVQFDTPEAIEALEWWQSFWDPVGAAQVAAFNDQYKGATAAQAPFTVGAKS